MHYENVCRGRFVERPNRFIAFVDIDGKTERCHVKNTGRCKEILTEGSTVVLNKPSSKGRSTAYDVIAVYKNDLLINIDSQAPNEVVAESFEKIVGSVDTIRREFTFGDSRIDIYAESGSRRILAEVKGVTLENDGIAIFPDAPTERGLKHVRELEHSISKGFEPYLVFLVQMSGMKHFSPNYEMQEEFGTEVEKAAEAGVKVVAYGCIVSEDSLTLGEPVPVIYRHS
jgi:sugar fermentation stimulation protein A